MNRKWLFLAFWLCCLLARSVNAQDDPPAPQPPKIAEASDEATQAVKTIKLPDGWQVKLFAAEPDVANPVAFHIDFLNRLFVCESFRQEDGIEDNREHPEWLVDDLAAKTVADRERYIRKHIKDADQSYTQSDDRIRLLVDTDKDGVADRASIFSDRYNSIVSGTGAGVLSYRGNVFFTCIPDLWLLQDRDNDGRAEVRRTLASGFGVRFAFRGHDLHGLIIGPDGRLYFSIGDRGYHLNDQIHDPASGAVFRCELDGSQMEVVATGLRNPQELAFDDYGNLFTGDNNSDSGDKARWVYVAEGGDSGWRMYYQYLPDRGPFNREKIWHPYNSVETPTYVVPPIVNLADGPSGLAYYPGTGLSSKFERRFFLCDFRGQKSNSGIRTFRVVPDGAFFRVVDMEQSIWNILPTDVDFGPDGKVYFSDWVHGWIGVGKGRIYTAFDPTQLESDLVKETQQLLSNPMKPLTDERLFSLLAHADRRVRQEAQFELAERGPGSAKLFLTGIGSENEMTALHSLWGIGQIVRKIRLQKNENGELHLEICRELLKTLPKAKHAEVRVAAAALFGENQFAESHLRKWISDDNPRVAYQAALAVGKRAKTEPETARAVLDLIARNGDRDPMLRHAGVMALRGIVRSELDTNGDTLTAALKHPSVSVRLALAAAIRRLGPEFHVQSLDVNPWQVLLRDGDSRVALETARAIYDEPIQSELSSLARMADQLIGPPELLRRALHACNRLGGQENANRIAAVAANAGVEEAIRLESLGMLKQWADPGPLDRFHGRYWPIARRDRGIAQNALRARIAELFASPEAIVNRATEVAAALEIREIAATLRKMVDDESQTGSTRAAALSGLERMKDKTVDRLVARTLQFNDPILRSVARDIHARRNPGESYEMTYAGIMSPDLAERQAAWRSLGYLNDERSAALLQKKLNDIENAEASTQFDILESASRRGEPAIADRLRGLADGWRKSDDPLTEYFATRHGGDAERGRKIFYERVELSCVRCHKIADRGGDVGPVLTKIGETKTRDQLLESIVLPNKTIAEEFRNVVIVDF